MVDLRGITTAADPNDIGNWILVRTCPFCGKQHSIVVKQSSYQNGIDRIKQGISIQAAFPTFTPDEREFLMTGICSICWNKI